MNSQDISNWLKELFSDKVAKWVLRIVLVFAAVVFIYTGVVFMIDSSNGKYAKWLFFENNIPSDTPFTSENQKVLNKDTPIIRQKISKPIISKSGSKFDLTGASFNAPVQVGDNNIQNNIDIDPELPDSEFQAVIDTLNYFVKKYNITNKEVLIHPIPGNNASNIIQPLKDYLFRNGFQPNVAISVGHIKLSKGFTYKIEKYTNNIDPVIEIYLNKF